MYFSFLKLIALPYSLSSATSNVGKRTVSRWKRRLLSGEFIWTAWPPITKSRLRREREGKVPFANTSFRILIFGAWVRTLRCWTQAAGTGIRGNRKAGYSSEYTRPSLGSQFNSTYSTFGQTLKSRSEGVTPVTTYTFLQPTI
ncbi:hypothetical protein GALMADRAFT_1117232 [Galerina marginata CBS 339.88]|uniref:Secreted protein n=1 Tax=Galerina marginata (strain CBS 339.88) TaxID=685588 RepID=A0A067TF69_GALM3|nr:hypothetical protein GALMADRAFT_1117232 [Galerina marginata CBS 339.88]